ncbi:hypothetical protein FC96_GL001194 [Secundilactobacillus kimchicus JCM 15530]|uniref:Uncharacterized protein n=1 Tax=Secundilactobacillus kimchicus JCM 15530 TaxID=1302272 RepID=A0A0R1HTK6_9LACO|nr:hypothetical protein FC96_GL001194 [Secundilactobacillus kimchicus JCM 15530]
MYTLRILNANLVVKQKTNPRLTKNTNQGYQKIIGVNLFLNLNSQIITVTKKTRICGDYI